MRHHLWLAGLATCASISAANAAQDVEIVANSILRAYSDYCDPLFFEHNRAADAPVDATLAQAYARVLFTRDGGQCDRFLNTDVAPAAIVPGLLARLPELQRPMARTLTEQQLTLLGNILRYDDITQNECGGQPKDSGNTSSARATAEPWWTAVGRDDVLELAKGYVEADAYARATVGFPSGGGTVTPCSAREVVGMMITFAVTGPIMPQPPENNTSTQEFEEEAMNPFFATWSTAAGCTSGGELFTIGRFTQFEPALGFFTGRPRIIGADMLCDVSPSSLESSTINFDADCMVDGKLRSLTGSVQEVAPGEIDLAWTHDVEPVRLFQCG